MTDAFRALPEQKRARILRAAYREFGERGFSRASTNTITREAGISKGMLFYYFGSKQELFNDLVEAVLERTTDAFMGILEAHHLDYFEFLYALARAKLQIQHAYPEELQFLSAILLSGGESHLRPELRARFEGMQAMARERFTRPMDMAGFRRDIPEERMRDMLGWITQGYEKRLMERLSAQPELWKKESMDALWAEYYAFLSTLKRLFLEEGRHEHTGDPRA